MMMAVNAAAKVTALSVEQTSKMHPAASISVITRRPSETGTESEDVFSRSVRLGVQIALTKLSMITVRALVFNAV